MSPRVYVISDLHLGHKKILDFSNEFRSGATVDEHDSWIIDQWNSVITERDTVYVLGDVAFSREALKKCLLLRGNKKLITGNHDVYKMHEYSEAGFEVIRGLVRYKGFWLSHAPIHPLELRGLHNIHGHLHDRVIDDDRYVNVCVERLGGKPTEILRRTA